MQLHYQIKRYRSIPAGANLDHAVLSRLFFFCFGFYYKLADGLGVLCFVPNDRLDLT